MTSDDAAAAGRISENKAEKSEMPPNEATPAAVAAANSAEANGGKDAAPSSADNNADVEAGKILEQDGVGKVEFTANKNAEDGKKVRKLNHSSMVIYITLNMYGK